MRWALSRRIRPFPRLAFSGRAKNRQVEAPEVEVSLWERDLDAFFAEPLFHRDVQLAAGQHGAFQQGPILKREVH